MSDLINLSARYVIKTDQLGATNALASTPDNDTLLIEPFDASRSQLWYFEESDVDEYYHLHTEDKGDEYSLDIYNYEGSQTIDLRFKETQDLDGQYWHLHPQSDGSVKVSNNHTGSDTYLDVEDGSLKPMLAARDSPNQEWTLSSLGSPTSTQTPTASSTSPESTITPASSSPCTSECSASSSPLSSPSSSTSGSSKLETGAIVGIAVGSVGAILLVVGAIWLWRRWKKKQSVVPPPVLSVKEGYIHG
jgi:hypothetical protein